jgi:hypothetical protein
MARSLRRVISQAFNVPPRFLVRKRPLYAVAMPDRVALMGRRAYRAHLRRLSPLPPFRRRSSRLKWAELKIEHPDGTITTHGFRAVPDSDHSQAALLPVQPPPGASNA